MIGTMVAVLGGFAWMIARSYRLARRAPDGYRPEGKRWTEEP